MTMFGKPLTRRDTVAGLTAGALSLRASPGGAQAPAPTSPQPTSAQTAAPDERVLTLIAEPASRQLRAAPAPATPVWRYRLERAQGDVPAETDTIPVVRIARGEVTTIRLVNRLPQPTTLHAYGLRDANAMNGTAGLTQAPIPPGQSFDYRFTPRDSGTFWLHPLVPGSTAEQVERGLSALLVVEETTPIQVDADVSLVVDDWRLSETGAIAADFMDSADVARVGRLGNMLTVNGAPSPHRLTGRPRARLRVRLVCVANARIMPLRFEGFAQATVIAIDGQPCDPFDPLRRQVILAPGSRYDVLLDLVPEAERQGRVLVALGDGLPLLVATGAGEPLPAKHAVVALPPNVLPTAIRLQDAQRAELAITGGQEALAEGQPTPSADEVRKKFPNARRVFTLNFGGSGGFDGRALMNVKRGAVCVIAVNNRTAIPQVMHVQGHVFRLLHALDDGWEPYFLDTIVVPAQRTYRIALIADNPGKWAIRSSVLEHMEGGVLTWFNVAD
jgi:FtsP/CotA-like multicopper oxidase with cupredoxin domain